MSISKWLFCIILHIVVCAFNTSDAEDTEVYLSTNTNIDESRPNILFVLDTSGSMKYKVAEDEESEDQPTKTRMQVLKDVMNQVVEELSLSKVKTNVGLMRYNFSSGGTVLSPIKPLNTQSKADLLEKVSQLSPEGWTPISDVMLEAGAYFRGDTVHYGEHGWDKVSPSELYVLKNNVISYKSPIKNMCQKNFIIFLSDGAPTMQHQQTQTGFKKWSGASCNFHEADDDDITTRTKNINKENDDSSYLKGDYGVDCANKITKYLYNNKNHNPAFPNAENIVTYTIGFAEDVGVLKSMVSDDSGATNGRYKNPNNATELLKAFNRIFENIGKKVTTTLVSAGITVNQFNRITHSNYLYYSLFSPKIGNKWSGNIKGYKILNGKIVDANDRPAMDWLANGFKDSARSLWLAPGESADGANVEKGGVAAKLGVNRKVYSNIQLSSTSTNYTELTSNANTVNAINTSITASMLGISNRLRQAEKDKRKAKLLNWLKGIDVNNAATSVPRKSIGDPLHSSPRLVNYNTSRATMSVSETLIFVGTNNGFLHAFETLNGTEKWSFIPKTLLSNLYNIVDDPAKAPRYGLDGEISIYHDDTNKNGVVDVNLNEKAYLYIGMRRGGSSYFALDISNPDEPMFMFEINKSSNQFSGLGQTWSKPYVGKMNVGGNNNNLVLIFGGGYDTKQDENTHIDAASQIQPGSQSVVDTKGNRVFIADALSGAHLWNSSMATQASNAGAVNVMNSIPAPVKAFDLDGDNLVDHFYVSDTKAQIFRFDIDNAKNINNITGGRIAHFGANNSVVDNRRFYYEPDAALIKQVGNSYVSLTIGSGYRAYPLDKTVQDYIYVVKDNGIFSRTFKDVSFNDLANVNTADFATELSHLNLKNGWYIELNKTEGEKIIQRSMTVNNIIIIASYRPPKNNIAAVNSCGGKQSFGSVYKYTLSVTNGSAVHDVDGDGKITVKDRAAKLKQSGLVAPPMMTLQDQNGEVVEYNCFSIECSNDNIPLIPKGVRGLRWKANVK